jgi:hypothetical protein
MLLQLLMIFVTKYLVSERMTLVFITTFGNWSTQRDETRFRMIAIFSVVKTTVERMVEGLQ